MPSLLPIRIANRLHEEEKYYYVTLPVPKKIVPLILLLGAIVFVITRPIEFPVNHPTIASVLGSKSSATRSAIRTKQQSDTTITKEEKAEIFLELCGCPTTCSHMELQYFGKKYHCVQRIHYLQDNYKTPRLDACRAAVNEGVCRKLCHPDVCSLVDEVSNNNHTAK